MKVLIILTIVTVASCGRLDNLYLPPNQRNTPNHAYLPPIQRNTFSNTHLPPTQKNVFSNSVLPPSPSFSASNNYLSPIQRSPAIQAPLRTSYTPSAFSASNTYSSPITKAASLGGTYLPPNQHSAVQTTSYTSNSNIGSSSGGFGQSSYGYSGQSHSSSQQQVPILKYSADNDGNGAYRYDYQTGNSITAQEQGDGTQGTRSQGSFSYVSPDGEQVSVSYTADENGFVPHGAHLPTPPPIPEAILKSLQVNAAAAASGGVSNDGQYKTDHYSSSAGGNSGNAGYVSNGGYRY